MSFFVLYLINKIQFYILPRNYLYDLNVYEVEEICIFHPKGHNLVILGNKDKKRAVIYTPFQPKKKEVAKQYHHTMAD